MPKTQVNGSQVLDATITDADVAAANKDGASGTASMRTLGTGAAQAAAGNHTHAHSTLTGLTSGDDHTQYTKFAGRSGGQYIVGDSVGTTGTLLALYAHAVDLADNTYFKIKSGGGWQVIAASTVIAECDVNGFITSPKIIGGTASGGSLVLLSTSHATLGPVEIQGGLVLSSDISATLTNASNNDDFAPTGFSGASVARLSATGNTTNLAGLAGGVDGKVVTLINVGTTFNISILSDSTTTSAAANRFFLPAGRTITLLPRDAVVLIYDATTSRWRAIGTYQRFAFSGGQSGGQSIVGGTASYDTLSLRGHAGGVGSVLLGDALFVSNSVSPAQITADQNDYAPTSGDFAFVWRVNADNNVRKITGAAVGTWAVKDGRLLAIMNVGATTVTLTHQDAGSTAANRFYFPGNANCVLNPGGSILLWYDSTLAAWTVLSSNAASGVLGTTTTSVSSTTTAETKSLVGTISGTLTIPANSAVIGRLYRLTARGVITTGGTAGTITFQLKYAATVIASTGAVAPTISQANRYWELEADIIVRTIGASGTFMVQGKIHMMNAATPAAGVIWPIRGNSADPPAVVTVDTTAASLIDLQSITSNALHTVTCNQVSLELLQ